MAVKQYNINDLQPGMVLAQPITDDQGRTILEEGSRLTPMHIKRLEKWGVDAIAVKDKDTEVIAAKESAASVLETASDEDREFMRHIASRVQNRFRAIQDNPLMDEMKRLAIRHLVENGRGAIPDL